METFGCDIILVFFKFLGNEGFYNKNFSHVSMTHSVNISTRFCSNSEADASELKSYRNVSSVLHGQLCYQQ